MSPPHHHDSGSVSESQSLDDRPHDGLETHRDFLLKVARKRLRRSQVLAAGASDFVQEALLAAWKAKDQGQAPGENARVEAAWLLRILHNKINETIRKNNAARNGGDITVGNLAEDDLTGSGTSPSGRLERKSRKDCLHRAIEVLAPQDREVALLLLEGATRQEIGDRLRVSASYASRLCDRATRSLHAAYLETGGTWDFP